MTESDTTNWEFIDDEGTFRLLNPQYHNALYFPLVNSAGIFSAVTPTFHGDIKAGHNTYLTPPVSVESLHDSRSARNFWVRVDGSTPWSATGNSAAQIAHHFTSKDEETFLEAGFVWLRVIRKNLDIGLKAEVTSFIPANNDRVELLKVTLLNLSNKGMKVSPTAAVPIYGRSADNLRDHRHVTSLLHRTRCGTFGVFVSPTLSFDERGHQPNITIYAVLGVDEEGLPPQGFFPVVEDFIGEGGSLDWPESIVKGIEPSFKSGMSVDGYESMGGLRFADIALLPGKSVSYILMLAIMDADDSGQYIRKYGNITAFDDWFEKTRSYWKSKLKVPRFFTGNTRFDGWMRWVTIQPILRRLFGNSFLPYHDYGRGGRGWRDLWQDILAIMLVEDKDVRQMLSDNFAGVRIDGSNATIIGSRPGDFKADRNNIPRVWMDHGVWPLVTVSQYIDQTGDLKILLESQTYFKDHLTARAQKLDNFWSIEQGTILQTDNSVPYKGTILEHLLVQHLVPFFNVGEHNNILLEGADWNDAMDMAGKRGESVAFSAFYAGNLLRLAELLIALEKSGVIEIEIAVELFALLDTLSERVDYNLVESKKSRLEEYFQSCSHILSGRKITIKIHDLVADLETKSEWLCEHIRHHEWLTNSEGYGWFNGYYDNDGKRVEGDFPKGVRMTLTGQVFALMGGVARDDQVFEVIRSVDRYLFDAKLGGYRLNSNFGEEMLNLGRGFSFAFGHKENGAMFSHMAVMYANALYHRGMVRQGYKVLEGIYKQSQDFAHSHIFPGIPEYINERGRGMYPYLTGSASWYLLTLVTEAFGVRGKIGDLLIEPKLVAEQFNQEGDVQLNSRFANRVLEIHYHNRTRSDYGDYQVHAIYLDGQPLGNIEVPVIIPRAKIVSLDPDQSHQIEIELK